MAPATAPVETHTETFQLLRMHELVASTTNPRKSFDPHTLEELAQSIREHGVIAPIVVRPLLPGVTFEIIDGARRHRAAQLAGLDAVPARVMEMSDADVLEVQLIANIQRDDLDPLEEAKGYRALIDSNKSKYSAAYIADRIGRSEKFVWDRMKLLDLLPEIAKLLEHERILVGHAELLAKLKPEDQRRAIDPDAGHNGRDRSGLWRYESTLALDGEDDDDEPSAKNLYRGLKPVTVKELDAWIARHVRFDAEHMAKTAPLDFGPVAEQIAQAAAQPGRGRKVISITDDYRLDDDAKDPNERTYGSQSWRRADGAEQSKTCDHSVLGVRVAGASYGSTLQVCIARDRCPVHFAREIKDREKNAKLRASGQGNKVAAREKKQQQTWQEQQRKDEEQRKRDAAAYVALYPKLVEALKAKLPSTFDRTAFEYFYEGKAPQVPAAKYVETLVMQEVAKNKPDTYGTSWRRDKVLAIAHHFGVDIKTLQAEVAGEMKDSKKAATKPATPKAKPAKKAKAKR